MLLLVEDNPAEARLTREALAECGHADDLKVVEDGQAACDYLHQTNGFGGAKRPNMILLDLNLPKMHGREVLRTI